MRKKIGYLVLAVAVALIVAVFVKAQQPKSPQMTLAGSDAKSIEVAPVIPDNRALAIRTEQLQQARDSAEFNQLLATDLGKRLVELQKRLIESGNKLQALTKGMCGDEKLWQLDLDAMKCIVAKPETTKTRPSPK